MLNHNTNRGDKAMKHTDVYKALQASGLVSCNSDIPFFSHRRCDNCNGLAGDRYKVEGYLNLTETQTEAQKGDNLYTLELCPDCFEALFS
jgi:hypothetical protein